MSTKHDHEQRYVDVYDAVIKLIREAEQFLASNRAKQIRQQIGEYDFAREYRVVTIRTHRQAGHTQTALRLLRRHGDQAMMFVHDAERAMTLSNDHRFEADQHIFSIDRLTDDNIDLFYKFNCVGKEFKMVIIDTAQFVYDLSMSHVKQDVENLMTAKGFENALLVELG